MAPTISARWGAATWRAFFGTPLNAALTVVFLGLAAMVVAPFVRWAILDAVVFPAVPAICAARTGACWSFVAAKSGQILFGIYPYDERWRPAAVCASVLALLGISVRPASWTNWLAVVWFASMAAVLVLMGGGVFGLAPVPTSAWGGLPVTLILTVFALGIAFPASIFLALGRRSEIPVVRIGCVLLIETVRGLPRSSAFSSSRRSCCRCSSPTPCSRTSSSGRSSR